MCFALKITSTLCDVNASLYPGDRQCKCMIYIFLNRETCRTSDTRRRGADEGGEGDVDGEGDGDDMSKSRITIEYDR